jgi:hypothetical protein
MPYTDELDPLINREKELRQKIARRIAEETGAPADAFPSQDHLQAADDAISAWAAEGEDDQDMRAFRPMGPLQELLADHRATWERILDIRDQRLS